MSHVSFKKPLKSFARKIPRQKDVGADRLRFFQQIYTSVVTLFPISSVDLEKTDAKMKIHIRLYNMRLAMPFTLDLSRSLSRVYDGKMLINVKKG